MGCMLTRGTTEADLKSQEIDRMIKKQSQKSSTASTAKLLLLGPGESGKSTIFKQMKIISSQERGFSEEDRVNFKPVIYSNCLSQMQILIKNANRLQIPLEKENEQAAANLLKLPHAGNVWNPEIAKTIKALWADAGIKKVYDLRDTEYHLNDSAAYFFDDVDRFVDQNFIPTNDDVLRVRVRSTGIEEATFDFDKILFKVVDVGGQRSERRKWIHCFEGVTTVIFCASLIGYCQTLREQTDKSRMDEAIDLFSEVSHSPYFSQSVIVLFLNKEDLFAEKIQTHPLNKFCNNYQGNDIDSAKAYIKNRFLEVGDGNENYVHLTIAVDTKNIEFVIFLVRKIILQQLMKDIPGGV
uniref:Uncharacterized protein n=1 Tax=Arcella intermedia TaxID=1963864 RepID=A0A6B2L8L4_9EUKA|eukprot:TRINITY_DN6130_c0_g1_i1.p1 TRINITY_DN6130_c0_g1~~TRINITY_DN6130_c0_g1_i1.p1  ORF type:complete len:354 (-),score=54.41 TRINITY_DN6130_c0_g1_i1:137-1198(-)